MKNNIVIVLLVITIGVLSGLGILVGVGNAVNLFAQPMVEKTDRMAKTMDQMAKDIAVINKNVNRIIAEIDKQDARAQMPQEDLNKVYDIPVGKSIVIGKADAPVTIVKFTDLQCPFCGRFYPLITDALKQYPDQVKVIIKHYPLPFHPNDRPAAVLALAANEQGKYRDMLELILENKAADLSEAKVKEYAKTLGLNFDRLNADIKKNEQTYNDIIADDMRLTQELNVQGTPTFFINGKKTNARDWVSFKAAIEDQLNKQVE